MTTENLSLLETKHLVEKSRGKLTMMVLRDDRKFLVSIPEVVDSTPNSEEDRRRYSSSELEGEDCSSAGELNVSMGSKSTKSCFSVSRQIFQTLKTTRLPTERPVSPIERSAHAGTQLHLLRH